MAKIAIIVGLVFAIVAPARAADLAVPTSDPMMAAARAIAVAHWGTDPCAGNVAISWGTLPENINAHSDWFGMLGQPETFINCAIVFNVNADYGWDWPKFCTVVEHEFGHLSGHDHVDDPHDIMSPYYVFASPECSTQPIVAASTSTVVAPQKVAPVRWHPPVCTKMLRMMLVRCTSTKNRKTDDRPRSHRRHHAPARQRGRS